MVRDHLGAARKSSSIRGPLHITLIDMIGFANAYFMICLSIVASDGIRE